MNKLISKPIECGLRKNLITRLGLFYGCTCSHSSIVAGTKPCNNDKAFPIDCPLQNGIVIPKTTEELIKLAKDELLDQQSDKKVGELITSLLEIKKRNRKNCRSYISGTYSANNCRLSHFAIPGSMIFPKCKGVNCGYFKTE